MRKKSETPLPVYVCHYESSLGRIMLAAEDDETLIGLWFEGQTFFGRSIEGRPQCVNTDLSVLEESIRWLDSYFSGGCPPVVPRIALNGTPYQMRVWDELKAIPYGETRTYGEIARKLHGDSCGVAAARSVGNACGRNPVLLMIPCHRVVGSGGKLTGYAGGMERKRLLLKLETDGHM